MNKLILVAIGIALTALGLFYINANPHNTTSDKLNSIISLSNYDWDSIECKKGSYETKFDDKKLIQYGIVRLINNEIVKFVFLSHHSAMDKQGGTLFIASNGDQIFISGTFCCEVIIDCSGINDHNELFKYLKSIESTI